MGYRRTITFPIFNTLLHQRFQCCCHCVRYHKYLSLNTDANSFGNLNKWIDNVREVRGEEALIMIVGNKSDLDSERAVENNLASSKISELGLTYMEVSAKTGQNIKEFFKEMACVIAGTKKSKEEPPKSNSNNKDQTQPARVAAPANNNNIKLDAASVGGARDKDGKKEKCKC